MLRHGPLIRTGKQSPNRQQNAKHDQQQGQVSFQAHGPDYKPQFPVAAATAIHRVARSCRDSLPSDGLSSTVQPPLGVPETTICLSCVIWLRHTLEPVRVMPS